MGKTPTQQTDTHEARGVRERTSESFEEPRRILNTAQQILDDARQARREHDADMKEIRQMMKEGAIEMKEIRQAIAETRQGIAETKQRIEETRQAIAETNQVADKALQFAKETSLQIDKLSKETNLQIDKLSKDADRRDRAYDKRLKKLETLFHGQWGKLMESLVKGDIIKLLQKRKIEVTHLSHEVSTAWDGKPYQFDIIAVNGSEVVVVEVKTTLDMADVNYFLTKLEIFKEIYPHHKDKTVYGAVAYLKVNQSADIRSEKEGLFVIRATGDSSSITNKKSFKPKAF